MVAPTRAVQAADQDPGSSLSAGAKYVKTRHLEPECARQHERLSLGGRRRSGRRPSLGFWLAPHRRTEISREQRSETTSLIRIYQPIDPDQIMTSAAPSPDSQQNYISGEIKYLTSPGFADAVAKQLSETIRHFIGNSRRQIIDSQPIGYPGDFEKAQQIVNAALKVYSDHVQQQARERGQAAIYALNEVISRLEAEAKKKNQTRRKPPTRSKTSNPRIQLLDLQRLAIEAQTERPAPIQVVQPPTEMPAKGAPSWSLGAVGGGLIGGLLALAAALAWRKRVGVVTSPPALEGQIEHILLPTVRLGALTESSDAYAGLARSLYAQLPAPRSGRILLIGASADSGTEDVAGLIAFAAAERATSV